MEIDNEIHQTLSRMVDEESEFFNRFRIYKRPNGTLWAILCAEVTEREMDTISLTDRSLASMRALNAQTDEMSRYLTGESVSSVPLYRIVNDAQQVIGEAKRFRIKESEGRREIHADITLRKGEAVPDKENLTLKFSVRTVAGKSYWEREAKGFPKGVLLSPFLEGEDKERRIKRIYQSYLEQTEEQNA